MQEQRSSDRESSTPEQPSPNQEAGQSQQDPTARTGESPLSGQTAPPSEPGSAVPAASETWVEGQPTSDADYNPKPETGGDSSTR